MRICRLKEWAADLHMCRWYIDRIRVALCRPILRFICTAMHHHEAEDFKVPFFFVSSLNPQ